MSSEFEYISRNINLNHHITPTIKNIVLTLRQNGYETYIVGGAVRDLLINRTPKDYDISTSATPEKIRTILGKKRTRVIGKRFKIVHYFEGRDAVIEISTFRKGPSQENQVNEYSIITRDNEYGSPYEDAWRRDFTVNSIFYDISSQTVIDYTSMGLADLENQIVRTIGDPFQRLSEDPVRILRALKLVGQYAFKLENETEKAILTLQEKISLVSVSRLSLELDKILKKEYSHDILKTLFEHGFLFFYLPKLHNKFTLEEGNVCLELLKIECNRLRKKQIYETTSLPMALIALPSISLQFTETLHELTYKYDHLDKKIIKKIIKSTFHPLVFPKNIIHEATEAIFTQHKIFNNSSNQKLKRNRNSYLALKLALVINEYLYKNEKITRYCIEMLKSFKEQKNDS